MVLESGHNCRGLQALPWNGCSLPSPLPAPLELVQSHRSGQGSPLSFWVPGVQPPMRTPGRHSPTDTCPAGRGTDSVEVWRERAVPSPAPGRAVSRPAREEIQLSRTPSRASPRGRVTLLPSSVPAPP